MAIFKCKMCGGTLEINHNETVATCEYCGTKQTLPKLDDERKANLYDRANHFRRNNDFDKAMGIYEKILNEDNTDAEAYWSLVLCRYGIEYVEDPATHKRVPTVNRAQFTSIFDDDNYKSALQYADGAQRHIYEEEAKTINEIQKGILAISQKEEPFDVFICYKETDSNGRRTPDSVLGQELYYQLTQAGYKVFFSRITLEDQLGSAYEPYIFAALNSAKVMVVLGTKPEFLNAVWVKNEWSRYLALIKNGAKKMLIPAYKDMDPYDLPEEFSHLQAQDMSKLGFMQDLVRGIQKIVKTDEPKTTIVKETVVSGGNNNTAPLLERAFMFLEDGDWNSADEYCEKVLDLEPKNPQAYLGKLMAELHVKTQEQLKDCAQPFDGSNHYHKVFRFGDEKLKNTLQEYVEHINVRNESARLEGIYIQAKDFMSMAKREGEYKKAATMFEAIKDYNDSAILMQKCLDKAEIARKDAILAKGKLKITGGAFASIDCEEAIELFESIPGWRDADEMLAFCKDKMEEIEGKANDVIYEKALMRMSWNTIADYQSAIAGFKSIPGWKDADEQISICQEKIDELKLERERQAEIARKKEEEDRLERERQAEIARKEAEKRAKRNKKIAMIVIPSVCVVLAFVILLNAVIIPNGKYNHAISLMNEGKYQEAISVFEALEEYKDSENKISECNTAIFDIKYNEAIALMEEGEYQEAISAFEALKGYKDSEDKISECNTAILDIKYNAAIALMAEGKYQEAISAFEALGGYKNSEDKISECNTVILDAKYSEAIVLMDVGNVVEAYEAFIALNGYKDSVDKANSIYGKYMAEKLKSAKVGDYVFFGAYEQDNNTANGKEDVEWLLLEVKDGKALLISKYALDCKPYDTSKNDVSWETCTLRKWLNTDFINSAFSVAEKAIIPTVTVSADKNPEYATNPGKATQDQVFLLSIAEANQYFSSASARQCKPTNYAEAIGVYGNSSMGNYWWLRSPGSDQNSATYVCNDGDVDAYGIWCNFDSIAVRPALWIDLNA